MRITFNRTTELEMTRLALASGVNAHDLAEALGNGNATFEYDQSKSVYIITRQLDAKFLGSFEELQPTAAGVVDSDFVAHG